MFQVSLYGLASTAGNTDQIYQIYQGLFEQPVPVFSRKHDFVISPVFYIFDTVFPQVLINQDYAGKDICRLADGH
jgi:hypothetical protein